MTDKTARDALDARFAGAVLRITAEVNALVAHDLITPGEGTVILSLLDQADTRRMMAAKRDVLGDSQLVDPSNLRIVEVTCDLGPDLCAKCWDAALAAESLGRVTGSTQGTYRDETTTDDGTRIIHQGTWRREDDKTGGTVYFDEEPG